MKLRISKESDLWVVRDAAGVTLHWEATFICALHWTTCVLETSRAWHGEC